MWQLVDNGYQIWLTAIPPMKMPITEDDDRFSQWAESIRKDVECTFGILKGRFRILKSPISVQSIHAVDCIWLTCYALPNWLLDIDGMDEEWVAATYESDSNDDTAPLPIQRLHHGMREPRTDQVAAVNYVDNGSTQIDQ